MSVSYLERAVYEMARVDAILDLTAGTAKRWIDGYERRGKRYPPIVRDESTGGDRVTWGEFVETKLLAAYRDAGVPMLRMRPVVERLRVEFGVRYPLATVRPFVDESRRVVYEIQEELALEESMRLVVEATSGQYVLSAPVREFQRIADFDDVDQDGEPIVARLRPLGRDRSVAIDPARRFGNPVVRSTPTAVLAELVRAGEPIEWIAEQYELELLEVLDALEFERQYAA